MMAQVLSADIHYIHLVSGAGSKLAMRRLIDLTESAQRILVRLVKSGSDV